MEWITSAALGAILAELVLGKRLGNQALVWGALFGAAPDLDHIPAWFFKEAGRLWVRDGAAHSLFVLALLAWWASLRLQQYWKKRKKKVDRQTAALAILLPWGCHLVLDALRLPGINPLWPIPLPPLSLPLWIDGSPWSLTITGILVIAAIRISRLTAKKSLPRRRTIAVRSLIFTILLIFTAFGGRQLAGIAVRDSLNAAPSPPARSSLSPTYASPLLWRVVTADAGEFRIGEHSLLDGNAVPIFWLHLPRPPSLDDALLATRHGRLLDRLSGHWLLVRQHQLGLWVADLRRPDHRLALDKPPRTRISFPHAWQLRPDDPDAKLLFDGPPPRMLSSIPGSDAKRELRRAFGKLDGRDTPFQLAGVPGALREDLITSRSESRAAAEPQ